jgi:hypothetical protein
MVNAQEIPRLMARLTLLSGLVGAALGVALGFRNGDAIGWSLVRVALLTVVFAYVSRTLLLMVLKGWIQSRMDHLLERAREKAAKPDLRQRRA